MSSTTTAATGAGGADRGSAWRHPTRQPWWPRFKRIATWVFFALVLALIADQARDIEWGRVLQAMRGIPLPLLAGAAALALASHALYSTFDLFGRRLTGHRLGRLHTMGITWVSYTTNLNLGSLVGGIAFRYRLYAKAGLETATVSQILGFSMATNWWGYLLVGGAAFALAPPQLPESWALGTTGLRVVGACAVVLALAALAACWMSRRREFTVRGHALRLPSGRMATLQLGAASLNWLLMGGVVTLLLEQRVPYGEVLGVLLLAAVAGVLTHVPAGLGVIETVFITLLGGQVPRHELLGALLAYRAVYYLLPLLLSLPVLLVLERRGRVEGASATGDR